MSKDITEKFNEAKTEGAKAKRTIVNDFVARKGDLVSISLKEGFKPVPYQSFRGRFLFTRDEDDTKGRNLYGFVVDLSRHYVEVAFITGTADNGPSDIQASVPREAIHSYRVLVPDVTVPFMH